MTRYDWTVTIDGVDVSQWVKAGGSIDYGTRTKATGFQSPTAVFEMFTKDENPNPAPVTWPILRLGDYVIIHVTHDGITQWRRFSGVIQALDWGLYGLRVTATGAQVDVDGSFLTPPYVGSVDWQYRTAGTTYLYGIPDQTEVTRVVWLAETADLDVVVEGVPARRVRAIPKDTPGTSLLDAVLRVADDCDALLLQDRLGVMRYRTKNFARPARYTIPSNIIESTSMDLNYERGTVINQVTVFYGEPDDDTGNQPSVYAEDTISMGELGPRAMQLYTDIRYVKGAQGKAADYLTKNAQGWEMPDVTILMKEATGAEAEELWDLQENWRVLVTDLPEGCPINEYAGDVLGFTELMHETDYRLILHLAPPFGDDDAPPEVPIFEDGSLSGGVESLEEDQYGYLWRLHTFAAPGSYVLTCNEGVTGEALIVAGGGGGGGSGGVSSYDGGGGGAGAVLPVTEMPFTPGTIAVEVGAGGAGNGGTGGNSRLANAIMYGGGGGGQPSRAGGAAAAGGFGGGRGGDSAANGAGLYGSLDGGVTTNTTLILGGPGNSYGASPGNGGSASYVSDISGVSVTYATGGTGGSSGIPTTIGGGGGGSGWLTPGQAGNPGIVIYRYRVG